MTAASDVNEMMESTQWLIDWRSSRMRPSGWKMALEVPVDLNATPFCLRCFSAPPIRSQGWWLPQ